MISFDTNLAVYASNAAFAQQSEARQFIESLGQRDDVVICELMLVELYFKLRNPKIFKRPLDARQATERCEILRSNSKWLIVESAPVMKEVWKWAARRDFAFRRIIDARLALTLRHHGVDEFATSNEKDFKGFGFKRVWNPLKAR